MSKLTFEDLQARMDWDAYHFNKSILFKHSNQIVIYNDKYYFFVKFEYDGLSLKEIDSETWVYCPVWFVQDIRLYE